MYIIIKTTKPSGKYRAFYKPYHEIMYNKIVIGQVLHESWRISLKVIKSDINSDGNPNCKWRWCVLKYKPGSLQDAKDFLKLNTVFILKQFNICFD
ncbi:MAG: hypothetical protein HQK96_03800 [Nitrospirae bacterium]|nr:hypothetical protein [Nitrospirota bacterium]